MTRKLHPTLKERLDAKVRPVIGPPSIDIKIKNLNLWLVAVASSCIGVRESGGENKGDMIELFQKTIGDSCMEPWCASFVQSMVAYIEEISGVKSHLYASESCMDIWHNSRKIIVHGPPQVGDLIVWQKIDTYQGHIGIIIDISDPKYLQTIEGNTGNAIGIKRDGDGVYIRTRPRGGQGNMRELGFLSPFTHINSDAPIH